VCAYSLGKAQRIFEHLDPAVGPIMIHGSIWTMCEQLGMDMSKGSRVDVERIDKGGLLMVPPVIAGSPYLRRFAPYSLGLASGWMSIRGMKRRRGIDKGFVLSDHADFPGLNAAIKATGAETVLLTHGYTAQFAKYLREAGLDARELELGYAGEDVED
jgi:putative mRNA 3-end processing factor